MGVEPLFNSLPKQWETVTLGEACKRGGGDIQTGPFGSQLHASDYVPIGIPSIMPKNIGENRVDTTDIARITAEDAKRLSRYLVKLGDIVYSRRGDVERRALIREEDDGWLCGTGCLRIRLGKGIVDPLYASYYLGHPSIRDWIVRHAIGATMPNLNTSILSSLPFVVPPIDEQKAIAHILGTLDDKIELNQQMNHTLEAIARALFKSWFIDFDPVRAKMEGREPAGNVEARGLSRGRAWEISDTCRSCWDTLGLPLLNQSDRYLQDSAACERAHQTIYLAFKSEGYSLANISFAIAAGVGNRVATANLPQTQIIIPLFPRCHPLGFGFSPVTNSWDVSWLYIGGRNYKTHIRKNPSQFCWLRLFSGYLVWDASTGSRQVLTALAKVLLKKSAVWHVLHPTENRYKIANKKIRNAHPLSIAFILESR